MSVICRSNALVAPAGPAIMVAITMAGHTSLGTTPINLFGTDEQKRDWLPELCSGRRLAAFGLTEPEAGSDAGNTKTTAKLDGGEWVINGAKQLLSIKIDPEAVSKEDVEMLQDMILAAVNDAHRKADDAMQQQMSGMMGGLKIPGMF